MQKYQGSIVPPIQVHKAVTGSIAGVVVLVALGWLPGCAFDPSGLPYSASNNTNANANTNANTNINDNTNSNTDVVCGNGVQETNEACDGTDLGGASCSSQGFDTGTLSCLGDCTGYDTSLCTGTAPVCGDDQREGAEICDGLDLAGQTCQSQGFDTGTLSCLGDCTGYDTSLCTGTGPVCGDGLINGTEVCDGLALGGRTCVDEGFYAGLLACGASCTGYDTSGCTGTCGDGLINGAEVCDDLALGGRTCVDEGFYSGVLACGPSCTVFDASGCTGTCGDGVINGAEVCDDLALGGRTCVDEGFYSGVLACGSNCGGFDASGCTGFCGDGVINGTEECDGADVGINTCASLGCRSGNLACSAGCAFDPTGCYDNHDEDGDGVDDNCDNCPTYPNPGQMDIDTDEVGGACEDPLNPALLSQITAFESLMTTVGIWTVVGGTWAPGVDEVTGSRIDNGANYLHATPLSNVDYSVEAMFRMDQSVSAGANWTAIVFSWRVPGGVLNAYECVYQRGADILSIWRTTGGPWNQLASTTITTTVQGSGWHRLRAYREGDTVRCTYADETAASAQLQISGGDVWADMSGTAGLRVYNETTTFTSFVIYQ